MSAELRVAVQSCVRLAKRSLAGNVSLEELRANWPVEVDKDKLVWRLMHEVEHYLVDQDIRAKDRDYEKYQENLIAALIKDVATKYQWYDPE